MEKQNDDTSVLLPCEWSVNVEMDRPTTNTSRKRKASSDCHDEPVLETDLPGPDRKVGRRASSYDDCVNRTQTNGEPPSASTSYEKKRTRSGCASASRALREELAMLHEEMEVAQYARTSAGNLRRKVPKAHSKLRTKKRRALESKDKDDHAHETDQLTGHQRLRGSKAAEKESTVEASLIFVPTQDEECAGNIDVDDEDEEASGQDISSDENSVEGDVGNEVEEDEDENQGAIEEDAVYDDYEPEGGDNVANEGVFEDDTIQTSSKRSHKRATVRKKKTKLYRMKNFRSERMAERHGEALGAMVRGQSTVAIEKLKQLAKESPSAPQVYSSLGMVYEDMLRGCQRRTRDEWQQLRRNNQGTEIKNESAVDDLTAEAMLSEQIDIAKKAYGAYHVSAILCKRDFSLWIRAADMALEIAGLHNEVLSLSQITTGRAVDYHKNEKKRWYGEAKSDYQAADQLKSPGIDVPAKLASVLMDLGCLSEALTLLTDLKNRPSLVEGQRSEFQSSYKAWILYSELMLRVGHECLRWNKGDKSNDNYTFRRWLRKWSMSFDWRERRLQALTRALEASAGTRCCAALLSWFQKRTDSMNSSKKEDESEDPKEVMDQDSELYEKRCRNELDNFDKTTVELGLADSSSASRERERARKELEQSLKREKATNDASGVETYDLNEDDVVMRPRNGLPLRASAATVFSIASDLMRLLLECKLCDGCRFVGEAVSSYMKARATLRAKQIKARDRFFEEVSQPTSVFAFQKTSYDEVAEDDASSGSEEPLSDQDEIDGTDEDSLTEAFRRGVLPPDLLFMYGLSLIGVGSHNFLGTKCLESIVSVENEPSSWMECDVAGQKSPGSQWDAFCSANSGKFYRIQAYVFAADIIRSLDKEKLLCASLVDWFGRLEAELVSQGVVEMFSVKPQSKCSMYDFKVGLIVSMLCATIRLRMTHLLSSSGSNQSINSPALLLRSMQCLSKMIPSIWSCNADKTLSSRAMSVLMTAAAAFPFLAGRIGETNAPEPEELLRCISTWLPVICSNEQMNLLLFAKHVAENTFDEIPFGWSWQSTDQYRLSLRCFNLAVGRNISYFSGWDPREFSGSPHQLRRRSGPAFYGITTTDGCVAGYLSPHLLAEIRHQWHLLATSGQVIPAASVLHRLSLLPNNPWYCGLAESVEKVEQENKIATFCEEEALAILLSFSRICLKNTSIISNGVSHALSVLVPLTQFCLNEVIWRSRIGREAVSRAPEEWQNLIKGTKKDGVRPPYLRDGYVRPSKRPGYRASSSSWFLEEDTDDPLNNLLDTTKYYVAEKWREIATTSLNPKGSAAEAMQKLHGCMFRLRNSFTESVCKRTSLEVAGALLDVAKFPGCWNGFACLQVRVKLRLL